MTMRLYSRVLGDREIEDTGRSLSGPRHPLRRRGQAGEEEEDRLREYFLTEIAPEEMRRKYVELKAVRKRKQALDKAIINTMVIMERSLPARHIHPPRAAITATKPKRSRPGSPRFSRRRCRRRSPAPDAGQMAGRPLTR